MDTVKWNISRGKRTLIELGQIVGHHPDSWNRVKIEAESPNVKLEATVEFCTEGDIVDVVEKAFEDTIYAMRESVKEPTRKVVIEKNLRFDPSVNCIGIFLGKKYGGHTYEKDSMGEHWFVNGRRFFSYEIERDDPYFVKTVEELGEKAGRDGSVLKIVEIPEDVDFEVYPSDSGGEYIAEKHRIWS